ncbi:lyase family protein [Priestia megaterium]|uniref:lyase family protein n=1 Tax=Priestia megaterium TaxID=1404 RepID=UPI0021D670DB|nr:lyase family protein [Priestia megaterium]MCU7766896.1 lyase family protein [Priestia megaterium]
MGGVFIKDYEVIAYRKEHDSFGMLEVPLDALYGVQTMRSVQNLSFSGHQLSRYPQYIKSLALVKKAAALANMESQEVDELIASQIKKACDKLIGGEYQQHFIVDVYHGGGGIGTNMNINEVIANLANESFGEKRGTYSPVHPITHVNASQSTSDVCHTSMRISILKQYELLDPVLKVVVNLLNQKAKEFMSIKTISRTCLQDGMQVRLGDTFSGYAAVIDRRHFNLERVVNNLKQVNLGGTVIGSGIGSSESYRNIILEKLTEVTGVEFIHRKNLYDAAQNIDDLVEVSQQLSLLATCLVKIAKDLRLLSSGPEAGFFEISLPSVQSGSSFFPGKVNPVIPETLIQCCFQVLGHDRAVQATLEHGELNLNIFESATGINILEEMKMLEKALNLFAEKCLRNITANDERCNELSNSFIPTVVNLKEKYGYEAVSKLINEKSKSELKSLAYGGGDQFETSQ